VSQVCIFRKTIFLQLKKYNVATAQAASFGMGLFLLF